MHTFHNVSSNISTILPSNVKIKRQRTSWLPAPALASALAIGLMGCPSREFAQVKAQEFGERVKVLPVERNRNLDILFVIDNSGSMAEEQASLVANFQRFINVLENIDGGLPNVHIGVVSTDVGAGTGNRRCEGSGDNGRLQNAPRGSCEVPTDSYIVDIANGDGSRDRNYAGGNLAKTFSCIAQLGTQGCGYEQPLESMRRALNGSSSLNAGFLRKDAFLAVIIISDEDDCSTENIEMFNSDTSQSNPASLLGPRSSFRCFEFGVRCDPDVPRSVGPRTNCVPREDSPYMYGVGVYVDFLKNLKEDPSQVIVAGIIGNSVPVRVDMNDKGEPELGPSCNSNAGKAAPAVRLSAFLEAFPNRFTSTTICNEDLSDALTIIAEDVREQLGNPCMEGRMKLVAGEPNCTVSDVHLRNRDGQEESLLAHCNESLDNLPCYHFVKDTQQCSNLDSYPSQLTLKVERGQANVPSETSVVAYCEME